ncbi:FIG010773: NAD-dependent epimerase/dehydratase [hydrothermal vent metagenome]|uniref:FIG010773: NAD-dependent epimerase/dehydratase n=1 Tax=hydrothermal vent metagenome TaxID=652676 RepID=A0A3B0SCY5_9ZZZZ
MIAITGATGFLGGHVTDILCAGGAKLRALVRDTAKATHLAAQGIELVAGDLNDANALDLLLKDCVCIIHIAGAIKARTPALLLQINGGGTDNLVAACARVNPDIRLLHISSITAREPQLSPYANSKAASEKAALAHKGPVVIIRPNAVYGPGDRETLQVFEVASGRFHPVINQPDARIAMIHAQDAAKAITALAQSTAPLGLFEISDPRTDGYSWQEITKTAVAAVGGRYRPIPVTPMLLKIAAIFSELAGKFQKNPPIFTQGKVREILHGNWSVQATKQIPAALWQAEIQLDEGFEQTVCWYRQQGWLR